MSDRRGQRTPTFPCKSRGGCNRAALYTAFLLIFCGCAKHGLESREGYVQVTGGRVWYRIVGRGSKVPLLVLHGGPGAPGYYLRPLERLGDERPVVFYDQLGCGRSDISSDTSLWNIGRFVTELGQVRQALGLKHVHLYGHSWGTILAVEYMRTRPTGVRSLILASPALSISRWMHDADSLIATLPDSVQTAIHKHEAEGTTNSPEYQNAVTIFYHRYLARREPWSPDIDSTFARFGQQVYGIMNGPSEFAVTGTLRDYEGAEHLRRIPVPTLFTCGRYDEATPKTTAYYRSLLPGSRLEIFEESAHLTMQDETNRYVDVIRAWLDRVDHR